MRRVFFLASLFAGLAIAQTALAAHHGPDGLFRRKTPEQAITAISDACKDRGFFVRNQSPVEVICQAQDLPRGEVVFRAKGPISDPHDGAQMFHTFNAESAPDGALVHESTVLVMKTGSTLHEIAPMLLGAKIVNDRVKELYGALGVESVLAK